MTAQDKGREEPDIETFIRENREMVERLLARERELISETLEQERADIRKFAAAQEELARDTFHRSREYADDYAERGMRFAEDAVGGAISMFTDPDFQRHVLTAGMEFMMALEALARAAPVPGFAAEAMARARNLREEAAAARDGGKDDGSGSGDDMRKIPITDSERPED